MEPNPFAARVSTELDKLQRRQTYAKAEAERRRKQEIEDTANLELARESMDHLHKQAAGYLLSLGIPTEIAKTTLGLDGFYAKGHTVQPTQFSVAVFPEGWIILRMTSGEASSVLTPDGKIFHVALSNQPYAKKGEVYEGINNGRSEYILTDDGPHLAWYQDQYGEEPPVDLENEFTQLIAKLIANHNLA